MNSSTTVHAPTPKDSLTRVKSSAEEKVSAPLIVKPVAIASLTFLNAMRKKSHNLRPSHRLNHLCLPPQRCPPRHLRHCHPLNQLRNPQSCPPRHLPRHLLYLLPLGRRPNLLLYHRLNQVPYLIFRNVEPMPLNGKRIW